MIKLLRILALLLIAESCLGFLFHTDDKPLIVGSFNIESLGPTKMGRPEFVSTVVKVLSRYDIVLIQEIKDSSDGNEIFQVLIDDLNAFAK